MSTDHPTREEIAQAARVLLQAQKDWFDAPLGGSPVAGVSSLFHLSTAALRDLAEGKK